MNNTSDEFDKFNEIAEQQYQEWLTNQKSLPRIEDFELGTLEIKASVIEGEPKLAMEFIQDNHKEVFGRIPDGDYIWTVSLNRKNAKEQEKENDLRQT